MSKKIAVVGSGFAGISAACYLAQAGNRVTVFEKNKEIGGRAGKFESDGFTFDKGPSWYWMPDIFEKFFSDFGHKVSDFYTLERLDPSYQVFFDDKIGVDIPASSDDLYSLFERIEPGSSLQLKEFLTEAEYKYRVGIHDLVYKPGRSIKEFIDPKLITGIFKLDVFKSISSSIRKRFKDKRLIQLLEFPVLFLGAKPEDTPALYSLMNYADMVLGTWYPKGGMNEIIQGMKQVADSLGVKFETQSNVEEIVVKDKQIGGLRVNGRTLNFDYVVAGADYHHVEQKLLPPNYRQYTEAYWDSRKLAPSSLIFYLGVDKKLDGLRHHNLFFDEPFDLHATEIYDNPKWPSNPLFYVCCPSKTDDSVAPPGKENIFVLIPVAPDLNDNLGIRDHYYNLVMDRLEKLTGQSVKNHVIFNRSYAHRDFISDYNSYKGNAYGLANTLSQTAILKPSITNKYVKNLYYTGQLTVPGPGVPPSLISGKVAAKELMKSIAKNEATLR